MDVQRQLEYSSFYFAEYYDPAADTWMTGADVMDQFGGDQAVVTLADGRLLFIGGISSGAHRLNTTAYDPTDETWTPVAAMNIERSGHTATLLADGKVLVVGGSNDLYKSFLDSAEIYDPEADIWTLTEPLEKARGGHTATLLNDGRVLVVGGQDNQ